MYDTLPLPADPGLTMLVSTAAPGTTAADALRLLASWAAMTIQNDVAPAAEQT
jgi:hypothetical protein